MTSQASIPILISRTESPVLANFMAIFSGVLLISLLAQIAIPLSWTPVPITGQTFAVSLVSLMWGWKRGATILFAYLTLGSLGLPIFAHAKSGILLGPTFGYLIGMFAASFVVGFLADKGMTQKFSSSLLASYTGSFIIFCFGAIGLSFFVPLDQLFIAGVLPFLPGDAIKNLLAATIVSRVSQRLQ